MEDIFVFLRSTWKSAALLTAAMTLSALVSSPSAAAPHKKAAKTAKAAVKVHSVPPGSYLYLVFGNAADGKDDDAYGAAYDKHMADVMQVPGFVSGQRFVIQPFSRSQPFPYRFVTVYEIKGDPEKVVSGVTARKNAGKLVALDPAVIAKVAPVVFAPAEPAMAYTADSTFHAVPDGSTGSGIK